MKGMVIGKKLSAHLVRKHSVVRLRLSKTVSKPYYQNICRNHCFSRNNVEIFGQ